MNLLLVSLVASVVASLACVNIITPDEQPTSLPHPSTPATTNITAPPEMRESSTSTPTPGRGLELLILSLTPSAQPGEEVSLRVLTAPTATATVEVHYPQTSETVALESQKVGPEGEISWTWKVPADSPPGEARVLVSASVIGRTLHVEDKFVVEAPP